MAIDLRSYTPARVALGRAGNSVPTVELLRFQLDHARARDAVHAAFDAEALVAELGALGLSALRVASRVWAPQGFGTFSRIRRLGGQSRAQLIGGELEQLPPR